MILGGLVSNGIMLLDFEILIICLLLIIDTVLV